ncbi:hypothetical protein P9X10_00915 [Bacillus cereus]|nr:hypothetical protein [Bacillus cereus]
MASAFRQQVSLLIGSENTYKFSEELKKQKRLRNILVMFLDKMAEDPEGVERWLNGDLQLESNGVSSEADEKILALKQNLAIFSSYIEVAQSTNEGNVSDFEDQLTASEFRRFKTNFEKSQQIPDSLEYDEHAVTVEQEVQTPQQSNKIDEMQDQINQLITMVQGMSNGNMNVNSDVKIPVTNPTDHQVFEESKTTQFEEEKVEVVSANIIKMPEETEVIEDETIIDETVIEPIIEEESDDVQTPVVEDKKAEENNEELLEGIGDVASMVEDLGIEI